MKPQQKLSRTQWNVHCWFSLDLFLFSGPETEFPPCPRPQHVIRVSEFHLSSLCKVTGASSSNHSPLHPAVCVFVVESETHIQLCQRLTYRYLSRADVDRQKQERPISKEICRFGQKSPNMLGCVWGRRPGPSFSCRTEGFSLEASWGLFIPPWWWRQTAVCGGQLFSIALARSTCTWALYRTSSHGWS